MKRFAAAVVMSSLLLAPPIAAQDADAPPTHAYFAYHQVNFADMESWMADYNEHTIPIMRDLQAEGVIEGWGQWAHHTGGDYNFMMVIRTRGWPEIGDFWSEYLGRLQERAPESFARVGGMIQAHRDEIWNIASVNFGAGEQDVQLRYDSYFQVNFDALEAFDAFWNETVTPAANQAIADGILEGIVTFAHNTGGRYNVKVSYFFSEWDHMDDFFSAAGAAMMASGSVAEFAAMSTGHRDEIWAAIPTPDGM